ncbi:MAG: ATP-dependent DNA helicase RecG [Candidatus Omnitrophica bacterium]|nr:ATP-dependent DNA helicase RecG [Candidatus Omnitrophota bacterium]
MLQTDTVAMPVRYLKGVGPKKAELLGRLGIQTVEDVLYYLPRRYEDRSRFTVIRDLKIGEYHSVRAKVLSLGMYRTKRQIPVFQVTLGDGTGLLYCLWFNMPFLKKNFHIGQSLIVYGKAERHQKLQMSHPDYEAVDGNNTGANLSMGRIVPVYPLTRDVTQRYLRTLIFNAVQKLLPLLKETLPHDVIGSKDLIDIRKAVENIHFPVTFELLERSYRRLVFDEFFLLQAALARKKAGIRNTHTALAHSLDTEILDTFKNRLPFRLTDGQEKAIADISRDMAGAKPMRRLLEGDVGSGKTVVALYGLVLTVRNGYQGVIMAPTEILARQHYLTMSELLMPMGINIRLLVSGLDQETKDGIKGEIAAGEADVVCGTHALIQEAVTYKNLGLVVVDEQHKFGVEQCERLAGKGKHPHILAMTATPIPRTLVMTLFGDMDISVIEHTPEGRKPITTFWVEEEERSRVYDFIREDVKKGRQAYIVYPRLSKSESNEVKSATTMYHTIQEKVFPDLKVALLHGKMASAEKEEIMKKFKERRYDILVATVVIEVGIDVPNASVMVIENAERFGLAQLHQLRGRIGRGEYDSYCILLGNPTTEDSGKRISKMVETQDGFEIAEEDLNIRGPGEFFGTRQHGLPELRFGNIIKDFKIMEEARKEAFRLVEGDPELELVENAVIREKLNERFKELKNSPVPPLYQRGGRE